MTQEKRQINHLLSLLQKEHAATPCPGIDYGWCLRAEGQGENNGIG
jgi:hypothetical protein